MEQTNHTITFSADGRYITERYGAFPEHTYEVVNAVPLGYVVWNISHPVAGEYLPLCRLSPYQPFPGGQNIDTDSLKAIRCDGAQTILNTVGYGPKTLDEMERFVEKHEMAKPGSSRHREVKRMKAALPFMRSLQWR